MAIMLCTTSYSYNMLIKEAILRQKSCMCESFPSFEILKYFVPEFSHTVKVSQFVCLHVEKPFYPT